MSLVVNAEVIEQNEVIRGYFRLILAAPEVAVAARPGQFLHVSCGKTYDPLLRRPVSIHAVDRQKGEVSLLYRVAGRGTTLLSGQKEGDSISILGPLGNGFTRPAGSENIFVVAGGIGVAPLYFFLQELSEINHNATVLLGASTKEQLLCIQEIKELGHTVLLATDDGSSGHHGTVVELFDLYARLPVHSCGDYNPDEEMSGLVYGCGPAVMLKELCGAIKENGFNGEISLEERMGCGVGACLSCVCKLKDGEDGFRYKRVCLEGPVFPAEGVVWS